MAKIACECAGTGRQARLRGVCLWRMGSSPITRTISNVYKDSEHSSYRSSLRTTPVFRRFFKPERYFCGLTTLIAFVIVPLYPVLHQIVTKDSKRKDAVDCILPKPKIMHQNVGS